MTNDFEHVKKHICECLDTNDVTVLKAEPTGSGSGSNVLDCSFTADGKLSEGILKIFCEGSEDYSGIGNLRTARKNILAAEDRDLDEEEVETVINEYGKYREIDFEVLAWHIKCWDMFWKLRTLVNEHPGENVK